MRNSASSTRPLACSLARFRSPAAVCAALAFAAGAAVAAPVSWDGGGGDALWTNPLNWSPDGVPSVIDQLTFGTGAPVSVRLNGDQESDTLTFTDDFTLGAFGTANTLTNFSGSVTVNTGVQATINARLAGFAGLTVTGGGSLHLTNPANLFTGSVEVSGAGTSLVIIPSNNFAFPMVRSDAFVLGQTGRSVNLTDGGELKVIAYSYNPDGGTKNIVLGTGGGAINVAAGFQEYRLDDGSQITGTGGLTKNGQGQLSLNTQAYALDGNHVVNAGTLHFNNVSSGTFGAFASTATITVNGGLLTGNSGTGGTRLETAVTLNTGGTLGVQGSDLEYGTRTGAGTSLEINGGTLMTRDAFNPAQVRSPRINSLLSGSGTLTIVAAGNVAGLGGSGHAVFQRSDLAHTFTGTLVLTDRATLESRANQGATTHVGNTIGAATIEMSGFNTLLDFRDNGTGSNQIFNSGASDYTGNDINVTGTQTGALYRLAVIRSNGSNTGNAFNFGTLSLGDHRFQTTTDGSAYSVRLNALEVDGNAELDLVSAALRVEGPTTETAAGQTLTKLGNSTLTFGSSVNVSGLNIRHGSVVLNGASGAIGLGAGGTASIAINGATPANNNPFNQGALLVDNTGGTNANRLHDSATITMRSNALLRLTSENNVGVNETTGAISVPSGFATFDVVRTGAPTDPVVLTTTGLAANRGTHAVLNFTGTSLGTAGDTARIAIPGQAATGFLGAWAVSGNEFAKYSDAVDEGAALGVTAFTGADYTAVGNDTDLAGAAGLHVKVTANAAGTAPIVLGADRSVATLNLQPTTAAATSTSNINTNGFLLTLEAGGIMSSGQTAAIIGNGTGGVTAGTTASPATLFITNNATLNFNAILQDNAAGGAVTVVKSGTGTLLLLNQGNLTNGVGGHTNTFTGGLVINSGIVTTSRGAYLGSGPITLAGGQLEIHQPASSGTNNSLLPGFGQNLIVSGNSFLGIDDNGFNFGGQELSDGSSGNNNTVPLGTLTIDGNHTLSVGAYEYDVRFTGSAFTSTPTINLGVGRTTNSTVVLGGEMTGSGFDVITNGSNAGPIQLGEGAGDTVSNAGLSTAITLYGGTMRLNKANGTNAIGNGSATEDVIINGGTLGWGPGHYLTSTGNQGASLNGTSGHDQIHDAAAITLLSGSLGVNAQANTETFGTLVMKGGTLNPGLTAMRVAGTATISGGAIAFNSGSTLGAGTLTLLSGAPDLNLTNTFTGALTQLEIGAGGLNLSGQNVNLGNANTSIASAGTRIALAGNLTVTGDPQNANSYNRGIIIQSGRELGVNTLDLMGGIRTIDIADDVIFTIESSLTNGGFTKEGGGQLIIQSTRPADFSGAVIVNEGVLTVRRAGVLGNVASAATISSGGTLKLEGGISLGKNLVISGAGALIPGSDVRELGALVSETGGNRVVGTLALAGDATIASNIYQQPATATAPILIADLTVASTGGITGTGTLTISGNGDGALETGLNTAAGGLVKNGAGRWTLGGPSTYIGTTTVAAGTLVVRDSTALGSAVAGTTVYGGATLELRGGVTVVGEALELNGRGVDSLAGSLVSVGGANSFTGPITLGTDTTVRSDTGSLTLGSFASAGGASRNLLLVGRADMTIDGAVATGATGTLTKIDAGTVTLRGNNTFGGVTTVNGGTLVLDNTVNNGSKLSSTASLDFGGGSVALIGNAAASTQTVSGVNLNFGGASIAVTSGVGGATFNLGSISRSLGTSVNFGLPASGAITTSTGLEPGTGILGAYATANGADWATKSGANIAAFGAYQPLTASGADTNESLLAASQVQTGAVSTNSLKLAGVVGLGLGANGLILNTGGLIHAGSVNSGISGTGTLSGLHADAELVIHSAGSGTLDIGVPLIGPGFGGLVKAGAGTLVLSGSSSFNGEVFINEGTLAVVGPGGTTDITALGTQIGGKNIYVNGGTFSLLTGFWDPAPSSKRLVIGPAGGTLHVADGTLLINDAGANVLSGTGVLTKTGGGRLTLSSDHSGFTGDTVIDAGILDLGNLNGLGSGPEQTITINANGILTNRAGTLNKNLTINGGLVNADDADRQFNGLVRVNGSARVLLMEFDTVNQNRSITFQNRVIGGGTFDVFGTNNGSTLSLNNATNDIAAFNLNANATVIGNAPGALGNGLTPTEVNLNGANSRAFFRHYADGNFNSNVTVSHYAEINVDRVGGVGFGTNQFMTIGDLDLAGAPMLTVSGGNGYTLRVSGAANSTGSAILNTVSGNVLFENGLGFSTPGSTLEKRGNSLVTLLGAANHTGPTIIHAGSLTLRGANGALTGTSGIELRGGSLIVDNGDAANANRLPDGAPIDLGGGFFRVAGTETTIGTVTATGGHTQIDYSPNSLTTPIPLTLTGFTMQHGATVNFTSQHPVVGNPGSGTNSQGIVSSRILIPGQADITGANVMTGAVMNNEFVRYSNAVVNGEPLGVTPLTNEGVGGYVANSSETTWGTTTLINRMNVTTATANTTLTADRTLNASKFDGGARATNTPGVRVDLNGHTLNHAQGMIIQVNNVQAIGNGDAVTPGTLTAGAGGVPAQLVFVVNSGTLEVGPTSTNGTALGLTGDVVIADNAGGAVSLVKSGGGTLQLRNNSTASTFTGGVFLNSGTLDVWRGGNLGPAGGNVTLSGGTLNLNIPDSGGVDDVAIAGLGQNMIVKASATVSLDNNGETSGAGTDNNFNFGSLAIENGAILSIAGFDSQDASFTSASFAGTPTINLFSRDTNHTTTIAGAVTGSGFYVEGAGGGSNGTLVLGGGAGDATPNTYSGPVTIIAGNNPVVRLDKAPGTTVITADADPGTHDLVINGGTVTHAAGAANQIAAAANVALNAGTLNFAGNSGTIASLDMAGGFFTTGQGATVTITGDVLVSGTNNSGGLFSDNTSTLDIQGKLTIEDYGRVATGATGIIQVGSLELTGTTLVVNSGSGASRLRLNGNVVTNAAVNSAVIGGVSDSDAFLELRGTRTFTVADGPANDDLVVNPVIINGTGTGAIIKDGPGLMVMSSTGNANHSFTGSVTVNEGTLDLNRTASSRIAIPGALIIGDGIGGANADQVRLRAPNQIADTSALTINSSGVFDLEFTNASETVGSVEGSGNILVGPNSVFGTNNAAGSTDFSGAILGAGGYTKGGVGVQELSGASEYVGPTTVNAGTLLVSGSITGSHVTVNNTATLAGDGTLTGAVTIASGGAVAPGLSPGVLSTGSFDLQSGASFRLELNGTGSADYDRLNVTGSVTLNGDLAGSTLGFTPGFHDLFYIIINDGADAVNGLLAGVGAGGLVNIDGIDFEISYDAEFGSGFNVGGNDVALRAIPEPGSFALLAASAGLLGLRRGRRARRG